jgi:hypothetical protein
LRVVGRAIARLIACLLVLAAAVLLADDPPRGQAAATRQASPGYDLSNLSQAGGPRPR